MILLVFIILCRKDRVLFLSLIFISEKLEFEIIKEVYHRMKDENYEDFEFILNEEYRVKKDGLKTKNF